MKNNDLFQKVRELKLPQSKYALFGSAQMGIRNLRDCRDIDIIVTDDLWNEYENKNGWQKAITLAGDPCLLKDNIEMVKIWRPGKWNTEELIREAEMIDGLPFVRLERVIEWKKLNAREKDLKDIEIIEKSLRGRE